MVLTLARLRKISDSKFDLSKTVVICGKGETISKISPDLIRDKYIGCVNSSTILLDRVDFLHITDVERFDVFCAQEKNKEKISNFLCPLQWHEREKPSEFTYKNAKEYFSDLDIDIYTYALPSQKKKFEESESDMFQVPPGEAHSSITILTSWLIKLGFRKFEFYGVTTDRNATAEYAEAFKSIGDTGSYLSGGDQKDMGWFLANYRHLVGLLNRHRCGYVFN